MEYPILWTRKGNEKRKRKKSNKLKKKKVLYMPLHNSNFKFYMIILPKVYNDKSSLNRKKEDGKKRRVRFPHLC